MEKPNPGLDALYETAQGQYVQRTFATTQREFEISEYLEAKKPEYAHNPLFLHNKTGSARRT